MSYFSKIQLRDQYGFSAENTPMDEVRVAEAIRLVGTTFGGATIDSNFWTATPSNNATINQTDVPGTIVLSSSTTNNGSAILQTTRIARYTGSISNRFRAQIQLGDIGVTTPSSVDFHVPFQTGLTVVVAGTVSVTVIYE